jgi:ATP-dependent protease ClpP protease subunit
MKNVYLTGEITLNKTLSAIKKQVGNSYADGINLIIDSNGGSVSEADAIVAYLKGLNVPLMGTVVTAYSAASKIVAELPNTKLAPNAPAKPFMIHEARVNPMQMPKEDITAADALDWARVLEGKNKELAGSYSNKTGLPEATIRQLMANNTYLSGDEAKRMKLVARLKNNNTMSKPKSNLFERFVNALLDSPKVEVNIDYDEAETGEETGETPEEQTLTNAIPMNDIDLKAENDRLKAEIEDLKAKMAGSKIAETPMEPVAEAMDVYAKVNKLEELITNLAETVKGLSDGTIAKTAASAAVKEQHMKQAVTAHVETQTQAPLKAWQKQAIVENAVKNHLS